MTVASSGSAVLERGARERIQRVLLLAVGIGALIFGTLLAPGQSGFLEQLPQLSTAYAYLSLAVGVVLPASFIVLHRVLPLRPLMAYAGATSLVFVAVQLTWPIFTTGGALEGNVPPWIQGITAIHATTAAIVWPRVVGWVYPLAQGPIVAFTQVQVRSDASLLALLDGIGAVVFCLILCGISIALIRAGERQDAAAEQARAQAAVEAARDTREAEQSRINAIVHDDVMSVLLAAARPQETEGLVEQARQALASVDSLATGRSEDRDYDPPEFVAVIRATVTRVTDEAPVSYAVGDDAPLPPDVVAAFAEATREAARNALRHGGVAPTVAIDVRPEGASVVVSDEGPGFSLARVGPRRLGLQVSIMDRMRTVAGGHASVASAPGRGTVVRLEWRRP